MALLADSPPDTGFQLTLAADPLAVRQAMLSLTESPTLARLSADHRASAEIVLAEVLNNIAEHAYAGTKGTVRVCCQATPAGLACQITDQGLEMPGGMLPAGMLPLEDHPEGGFGWFLIRSLTEDLQYRRLGKQNQLCFTIPA